MKKNCLSAAFAVACVFALAGAFYVNQQRSGRLLAAERAARLAEGVTPSVESIRSERSQPPQPPASKEAPASERQGSAPDGFQFMDKIMGALQQRREALEAAADLATAALWSERLGILLELSQEESETARATFHELMVEARRVSVRADLGDPSRQQAFADLERRLEEFLTAQFGPEKSARFRTAERARQEAAIEYEASRALGDVSEVIDLPPTQKDALYAAFANKARDRTGTFQPGQLKPQFVYSFQQGPRVSKPLELARSVLTAEQVALYERAQASESRGNQRAMQAAVEVMRGVFEEALGR